MVAFNRVKRNPTTFRYITGLTVQEFEDLVPSFESAWNNFVYKNFILRKERKRAYGGGNKPNPEKLEDKLLFTLCYHKVYPLQCVQGLLFDLDTSNANRWIHRLSDVLTESLGYEKQLPKRERKTLKDILDECPEVEELLIDGTERKVKRPVEKEEQEKYYSGKKKAHTVKNVVVTDKDRWVHFLSETTEGKRSDKKVSDEAGLEFPDETHLLGDLGFEGYEADGAIIHHPKKRHKGKPFTPLDKEANRIYATLRILVENAIRGVKISRSVKDTYRNYKPGFEDKLMYAAVGLHNYRVAKRSG